MRMNKSNVFLPDPRLQQHTRHQLHLCFRPLNGLFGSFVKRNVGVTSRHANGQRRRVHFLGPQDDSLDVIELFSDHGFRDVLAHGTRNEWICSIVDKGGDLFEMMCGVVKGGKVGGMSGEDGAGEERGDG